jgi:RNA 3'-phosphate cyclase
MIELNGAIGEGGGSVLRTAVALSTVSQQPIHIVNIRARRPKPGIRPQHLKAVEAVAKLANARVRGLELDSTEITFEPGRISGGDYRIDIGTAGSTTLILQAIMPAAVFAEAPVKYEIRGGTDNPLAPPIDFWRNITLPALKYMGYRGEVECLRRGHYPRGGGIIRAQVEPVLRLRGVQRLEPGKITRISGIAHCVRLPDHIAKRMAHAAAKILLRAGYSNVEIRTETHDPSRDPHLGPGTGITLWAETEEDAVLGFSALGKPGKPAEKVGREAAEGLMKQLKTGMSVDKHLTDQLIPYLALAEGESEITSTELTLHALTNVALVERILNVRFEVEGEMGNPGRIKVRGLGKVNPALREDDAEERSR